MDKTIDYHPIYLESNLGHGRARRRAMAECSHNLVALMDADDISLPDRFMKQLGEFIKDPHLDIVGGQITEFIDYPTNITGMRTVPEIDSKIKSYMKKRCPMNQMTVMMKKDAADCAGGYLDWYCNEDYYLWLRMAQSGARFANVPEILVNARIGDAMSSRRGGWKYFTSEARLQTYMLEKGIISWPRYLYNVALRFGGEVVLGDKMRTRVFKMMRGGIRTNDVGKPGNAKKKTSDAVEILTNYPPFSVAMCVYRGDNPEWFDLALESVIIKQSVKPSELVLVVDGPIPDSIQAVITKYAALCESGGIG